MKLTKGFLFIQKKSSKMFLVAILVSLAVWLLINLSKVYEKSVSVHLSFINTDKGTFVTPSDSVLTVSVKGTGFSLLGNKMRNLNYAIDTKKIQRNWTWNAEEYNFKKIFPNNVSLINVSPRIVTFQVNKLEQKRIPIQIQITVKPKLGYGVTSTHYENTHTTIYGAKSIIDTIKSVKTKHLLFEDVTDSISGVVKLDVIDKQIKLSDSEIEFSYGIERFTQGSFQVPIQIVNKPLNKEIVLFPKETHVQFQAPISTFSSYKAENFRVFVDFNEANETNKLPLHFDTFPKEVKNAKIVKQHITYLIVE